METSKSTRALRSDRGRVKKPITPGDKYNRLVIVMELPGVVRTDGKGIRRKVLCECICNNKTRKEFDLPSVVSGLVKSCGCLRAETNYALNSTHGLSGTKEHDAWLGMKTRCYDTSFKHYKNYGGRGILVFSGWINNFQAFLNHVGYAPGPEYTLDRRDNNLGYVPGNIRWITQAEQNRNHRRNVHVMHNGVQKVLMDASIDSGIPYGTLNSRRKLGLIGDMLFAPIHKGIKHKVSV